MSVLTTAEKFDILGVELEWKLRAGDTGGDYCALAATVPPGVGVPVHQHPQQEAFVVLSGHPEFSIGPMVPEWREVKPGELVNIPSDAFHGFRNTSDQDVEVMILFGASLAAFFDKAGTPLAAGPRQAPTMDQIQRVVAIAEKHGQHFAPPA